ncbi:hypothetical protein OAX78_04710, partial [Planctomycetota bacterium]|nr:hypothetical protein [Planctomycetota bacterium]
MASPHDIAFLKILVDDGVVQKPQAMGCLQQLDQRAQAGQPVSARQLTVQLGLITDAVAGPVEARVQQAAAAGAVPGAAPAPLPRAAPLPGTAPLAGVAPPALGMPGAPPSAPAGMPGAPPSAPAGMPGAPPSAPAG